MPRTSAVQFVLPWALALTLTAASGTADDGGRPAGGFEPVTLTGTAVELTVALRALGLKYDTEPVARQVVLKGDDGTITPLLSDDASRALFEDARLRGRRTEVQGRRHPGLPYLQVVSFKVEDGGRLRTPEYFCEICTISVRFPQTCPCCQGDMILRMR
jgi:hypothetical protein